MSRAATGFEKEAVPNRKISLERKKVNGNITDELATKGIVPKREFGKGRGRREELLQNVNVPALTDELMFAGYAIDSTGVRESRGVRCRSGDPEVEGQAEPGNSSQFYSNRAAGAGSALDPGLERGFVSRLRRDRRGGATVCAP